MHKGGRMGMNWSSSFNQDSRTLALELQLIASFHIALQLFFVPFPSFIQNPYKHWKIDGQRSIKNQSFSPYVDIHLPEVLIC
jgi:hypothetical protein